MVIALRSERRDRWFESSLLDCLTSSVRAAPVQVAPELSVASHDQGAHNVKRPECTPGILLGFTSAHSWKV